MKAVDEFFEILDSSFFGYFAGGMIIFIFSCLIMKSPEDIFFWIGMTIGYIGSMLSLHRFIKEQVEKKIDTSIMMALFKSFIAIGIAYYIIERYHCAIAFVVGPFEIYLSDGFISLYGQALLLSEVFIGILIVATYLTFMLSYRMDD